MKIGLFFGSFNPIHIGHLIIGNTMVASTDLDRVWFVVSPQNPFKTSQALLHEHDRLRMVELAIDDNSGFMASDVEFRMPRPSYTIDTMTYLQEKYPQHSFVLIIGEDNLEHFHKWKNHDQILKYFELYFYPRPYARETGFHTHPKVKKVDAPLLDISATFIRDAVKKDQSIQYLVPETVANYIRWKKFFL